MDATPTLCFTCGQAADCGPRLNRLEDGRVCPSCAERLMDGLPALLPGGAGVEADLEAPESASAELIADSDASEREEA